MILTIVIASISFLGFLANFVRDYIKPKFFRADIRYSADNYFISNKLAAHDATIVNRGKGVAHNITYYIELKPPYMFTNSKSTPKGDMEDGGEAKRTYEVTWKKIAPQNFISIRTISEAKKEDPNSAFPLETKLSDKKRIIERMYTP